MKFENVIFENQPEKITNLPDARLWDFLPTMNKTQNDKDILEKWMDYFIGADTPFIVVDNGKHYTLWKERIK